MLRLLTITAVEITSANTVCRVGPYVKWSDCMRVGSQPRLPPELPEELEKNTGVQAALRLDSVSLGVAWASRSSKLPEHVLMCNWV